MAPRNYSSDPDELADRASARTRSDASSSSEEEVGGARSAQERKREALYPPISSICSALGGFEEFANQKGEIVLEYSLGDQVIGCLKDLKRFWKMDDKDDDRTVARIFHEVGVLSNDLIPILLSTLGTSAKGDRIALAAVELIGAMTWPINVAEELRDAQLLDTLKGAVDYNSLIAAQLSYKAAILRTGALRAMFTLMSPSLTKTRKERTTKDENVISLVLHTFRNLAALKDRVSSSQSADAIEQSTLQSEYIQQLSSEAIFDLLLAIASNADSSEYAPWNMVALDIFHLIFRCVKPAELMVPMHKIDDNRLRDLLDIEGKQKRAVAKQTTSRHSRFGTTVALKAGGKQYILHKQSTLSVGAAKSLDHVKKGKAKKIRQDDDLQPPSNLRPEAIKCLHDVAISFLDSSFNPFLASVLTDIRMERLKVKESDTIRFLFLSRFFLEFFLLVYQDEKSRGVDPQSDEGHDFDLIAEMTEPASIGFVTVRLRNALEEKPVMWTELHAGIDCFIQMLLVIEGLTASGSEDNVDTADILQNKLYYESETLEMVLTVIATYKTQSIKYLDSVIHLSYVLLRMLEKYSKSKAYMYVRKKKSRAGKKKAKKVTEDDEGDGLGQGDDDEEEELARGTKTYSDHSFEFEKFEAGFACEPVLQTCMVYLEGYKTFTDPEQMKRIVSLMHRQAIKAKTEALFFKPTVLELFQRILDDEAFVASKDSAPSDLKKLIEYILRKFFKVVKERPMRLLEIFWPKTNAQLKKMRNGAEDEFAGSDDEDSVAYKFKMAGELEVEPGFSLTQQIGIVLASLTDDNQLSLIDLVKNQLALASAARTEIVLTTDGDNSADAGEESESDEAIKRTAGRLLGPSNAAVELFTGHNVEFGSDEERQAGSSNPPFKLLLRLLRWESSEVPESTDLVWTIPASLLPSTLDGDIKIIDGFLEDPVDPNGKRASELLRKTRKKPVRKRRVLDPDEEEAPKRQKKRKEEIEAYKSAQFIEDSDDEDNAERDAIFFAAESALRDKLAAGAISSVAFSGTKAAENKGKGKATAPKKASKGKATKPKQATLASLEPMSDLSADDDVPMGTRGSSTEQQGSASSGTRKRALSDASVSSPAPAVDPEEEEVGQTTQAKKRRIVVDSDDD